MAHQARSLRLSTERCRPEYKVYKKTRCQTDVRQVCGWDFQCAGSKCKEKIPKPRKSSTFVMTHNLHKYVNTRIMEIVWHTDWHFLTCILTELFFALILLIWLICVQTRTNDCKQLQTITNIYVLTCILVPTLYSYILRCIDWHLYWHAFLPTSWDISDLCDRLSGAMFDTVARTRSRGRGERKDSNEAAVTVDITMT